MYTKHGTNTFKLVVNMVNHEEEARAVFKNLSNAIVRFLKGISLEYVGFIPRDSNLEKAVRQPRLADKLLGTASSAVQDGNIKFFWKKLVTA